MNVLEIVRDERPDVAPLDARTRAALRERIVGNAAWAQGGLSASDSPNALSPVGDDWSPRRHWLSIAAVLLVSVGLAAVIVAATRPAGAPPAAPPSTTADRRPLYPSPTVPVVESLPDPLVVGEIDPPGKVDSVPTTASTVPIAAGPTFPLLGVSNLPAGYELASAVYAGHDAGLGIARYASRESTTQLQLTVRSDGDMVTRLDELGRTFWNVDGTIVYDAGEGGGGCLPDVCSIGWMWGESSFVTLDWVHPNGGSIDESATQASLLELVTGVVEQPDIWVEGDPETGWSVSDTGLRASAKVLLPGDEQGVEHARALMVGPPGMASVALLAPDGSTVIVRLLPNTTGVAGQVAQGADSQSVGGVPLVADAAGTVTVYDASSPCWLLSMVDGGSVDGGAWRDAIVELTGAIDVNETGLAIRLPGGWSSLGPSGSAALHQVIIRVPGEPEPVFVDVSQGPGSAVGFANALAPRGLEVVSFLDGDAWVGVSSEDPIMTSVFWQRNGTSYVATSELDVGGIAAAVADMQQATVADWNERYGAVEPPDEPVTAEGCPLPTLSVAGG